MSVEFTKESVVNPAWSDYQARFSSLPEFYFRTLTYPTSCLEAERLVGLIQLEMNSIDAQFIERRVEVAAQPTRPAVNEEHERWKLKAMRAVRMKSAQIQVLQAWIADHSETVESRFLQTNSEITALRKGLLKLMASVELSDEAYTEIIKLLV